MSKRDLRRDHPFQDTIEIQSRQTFIQHPAVLALLVAMILGLLYMAYRSSGSSESLGTEQAEISSGSEAEAQDGTSDGATSAVVDGDNVDGDNVDGDNVAADGMSDEEGEDDGGGDQASTNDQESDSAASTTPGTSASIPAPDGAFVAARLNLDAPPGDGLFVLSGRVPDQSLADQVRNAAELSYGPFVQSELEVDASLEPAPWLSSAPLVVGLLPSVTDGTIMVADEKIWLSARSPNPDYLQTLQGALGLLGGGLPVETVDTVITDLDPPTFNVVAEDDRLTLSGVVPSVDIATLMVGAAASAYGEESVDNELAIDPGTYRSFWMQIMPGALQLLRAFPDYQLAVQDGRFTGSIQGGINFAADSTEITDATAQALDIGVSILARDISIGMTVTGHTDSQGPDDYNQALSLARSQSVVDYFVAGGIDSSRLTAEGAGESEPVADNTTEDGRAANRRVEFEFGPPVPAP